MSIQANVRELKEINTEIKRLRGTMSELKKRGDAVKKSIIEYLNEKEQPGLKDDNTALIIENKPKKLGKSKKDIEKDSLKVLQEHGISNAADVLKEILKARRGDEVQIQQIKIQPLKKK
jgi:hypothetical protein